MPLTEAQREEYLAAKGVRCPFCKSYDIGSTTFRPQHMAHAEELITETIGCDTCGKRWVETYTLTAVDDHPDAWTEEDNEGS